MKKSLLFASIYIVSFSVYTQNVGIGNTNPTHSLHITPLIGNNPLRIDGLNQYVVERNLLVLDPLLGVVKHMHIDSLAKLINDNDWRVNPNGTGLEGVPGNNIASGISSVSAGSNNIASGNNTVVSGGINNNSSGDFNTIGGGNSNITNNDASTVGGGQGNNASGLFSTIAGGFFNIASNSFAFVGGGEWNVASGDNSIVLAGERDSALSTFSSVLGGLRNISNASHAVIIGGQYNKADGINSLLYGFNSNTYGDYSVSIGQGTNSFSHNEIAMGRYNTTYIPSSSSTSVGTDRLFSIGNGSTTTRSDAVIVQKNNNLFIGSDWSLPGGTGTRTTSGDHVIFINRGTAPGALNGTNKTAIWNNNGEIQVKDESNNVTTISPHNFSLIPNGASEAMSWAYYSERNDTAINVDMIKMAREIEKLSGEKLVYIKDLKTDQMITSNIHNEYTLNKAFEMIRTLNEQNSILKSQNIILKEKLTKIEQQIKELINE